MSLTTILSEIWRFLKDNLSKVFAGAVVISVLAVLAGFFLSNLMEQPADEAAEEQLTELPPAEDAQASRDYLTEIFEQEPAEFEIFIQQEDGNTFGNSFIFDEYFTAPAVVEEIEQETGVEYAQTLAHELNLGLFKTSQYRGSIAGLRDTSSNVMTIRVHAAQSSQENLILAETFANQILENEIPFMQGLSATLMREPSIGEHLTGNHLEMVSSPEALELILPAETESRSMILYAIAGFILGLLLTAVVLFILQLFKDTINYAFQYSWDFEDHHFVLSKDSGQEQINTLLLVPEANKQLLVAQESPFSDQLTASSQAIEATTGLSRLGMNNAEIDEIVLLVESKVTDKNWYNEQYRLAEMSGSQLTILQVMNG